jgi:hypothetical protein
VEPGLTAVLDATTASRLCALDQCGTGFIELPCGAMSVAELYNARLDGRPVEYDQESLDKADPWGILRAPLDPVIGFGEKPDDKALTILKDLVQVAKIAPARVTNASIEKLAKLVNEHIQTLADPKIQRWPRRMYLLIQTDHDKINAKKLKQWLPDLRLCYLDEPHADDEEGKLCTVLHQFFDRKRKREGKK